MMVVSSKEFASNQKRYFDIAVKEDVYIQNDENMFHLVYGDVDNRNSYHHATMYEEVLEPDDDFYNAITMDELRESAYEHIHKLFMKK